MSTEVTIIDPKEYQIEESKAKELLGNLPQIQLERDVLKKQFNEVIKLDIDDKETPKVAKELRLKILKNRTQGLGTWHKTTKDYFLKGGQFVDAIKRKEEAVNVDMESTLEAIEKHAENQEKERIKELQKTREILLSEYVEDVSMLDLGGMADDVFEAYLGAKKQAKAEREIAEREAEEKRLAEEAKISLHLTRKETAMPYYSYWTDFEKTLNFGEQSETDFSSFINRIKSAKKIDEDEKEAQRIENQRLKAEAEAKEKIRQERGKEMQPYIVYIRDYNKLLEMTDEDFKKEMKSIQRGAMEQMKYEGEKLQREENERIAEAKRKQQEFEKATEERLKREAEAKAEAERKLAEENSKKEAEKLAKSPIKKQMIVWIDSFNHGLQPVENETSKLILEKFNAFKAWSKEQIEKL